MKRSMIWLLLPVVLVATAPVLAADNPPPADPAVKPAPAAPVLGVGEGMVVFIDPETGKITTTPTAQQRDTLRAALAAVLNQSDEGLVDVYLPNGGGVMRDLQGRFQSAVVVRKAADGTPHHECVESAAQVSGPEAKAATGDAPVRAAK